MERDNNESNFEYEQRIKERNFWEFKLQGFPYETFSLVYELYNKDRTNKLYEQLLKNMLGIYGEK